MKLSKIITTVCTGTLVGAIGITAFATPAKPTIFAPKLITQLQDIKNTGVGTLTDGEKSKLEADIKEKIASREITQTKWKQLTDAQKKQIFDSNDKIGENEKLIIDKYLELGLIDEKAAEEMKERLEKQKATLDEQGRMPMLGESALIQIESQEGIMLQEGDKIGEKVILTDEKKAKLEADMGETIFIGESIDLTDEQKAKLEADMRETMGNIEDLKKKGVFIGEGVDLTEQEKSKLEAEIKQVISNRENMNNKWDQLTDMQKEEIFDLNDKVMGIKDQIVDQYLKLEVIDEKTAEQMKAAIKEQKIALREHSIMPIIGGIGMMKPTIAHPIKM